MRFISKKLPVLLLISMIGNVEADTNDPIILLSSRILLTNGPPIYFSNHALAPESPSLTSLPESPPSTFTFRAAEGDASRLPDTQGTIGISEVFTMLNISMRVTGLLAYWPNK